MNLEDIYMTLRGASDSDGAKFEIVQKWFNKCRIIDGIFIKHNFFVDSYKRLCPNEEELSLVKFIQLMGILSRESKQHLNTLLERFRTVHEEIISEIRSNERDLYK